MALSETQIQNIKNILTQSLRHKLDTYRSEKHQTLFYMRLMGKDRMALFWLIQSLNITFRKSIFEPIAIELAKPRFPIVESHIHLGTFISSEAHQEIQRIIDGLTIANLNPNKSNEIEKIRTICRKGNMERVSFPPVELMLQTHTNQHYYLGFKTDKLQIEKFKAFKRTLLEWAAAVLAENPDAAIHTAIAIPYNPYEPRPYERWRACGMLDIEAELFVGKEFWDMVGGAGAYEALLDIFEAVGIELRPEIDARFAQFR